MILRKLGIALLSAAAVFSAGACLAVKSPAIGLLYTNVQGPVTATSAKGAATKTGTACASSILGLIASGDASIDAAKASAGITEVASVDDAAGSLLGIYGKYCVTVKGN